MVATQGIGARYGWSHRGLSSLRVSVQFRRAPSLAIITCQHRITEEMTWLQHETALPNDCATSFHA